MEETRKNDFRVKIIDMVKYYPFLYDKSRKIKLLEDKRKTTWIEIGYALNMDAKIVEKEWNYIRCSLKASLFVRRKIKLQDEARNVVPNIFEKHLTFLLPHLIQCNKTVESGTNNEE